MSASGLPAVATDRAVPIVTAVDIARPPRVVFDYVTTPALWHTWHPATAAVRDVPQRPLRAGETAVEVIAVAGRRNEATWTVEVCEPPECWVIATDTAAGAARIVYRIAAVEGGSRFERTLRYRSKTWPWRALDSTLMRWILQRQSARALRNLKRVLEA
jgi:uncharacterized protein YndB with AHSA1/START domain